MPYLIRSVFVIAGVSALAVAARVQGPPNVLEVVIVNGPLAGTYKPPTSEVICLHAKREKRYSAAWKDFNAHDAKSIAEVGINVSNPDDAGAKRGGVRIAFGYPEKKAIVYTVDQAPLTFTVNGKGANITFEGHTKEDIQLRVTAKCSDVEEF